MRSPAARAAWKAPSCRISTVISFPWLAPPRTHEGGRGSGRDPITLSAPIPVRHWDDRWVPCAAGRHTRLNKRTLCAVKTCRFVRTAAPRRAGGAFCRPTPARELVQVQESERPLLSLGAAAQTSLRGSLTPCCWRLLRWLTVLTIGLQMLTGARSATGHRLSLRRCPMLVTERGSQ